MNAESAAAVLDKKDDKPAARKSGGRSVVGGGGGEKAAQNERALRSLRELCDSLPAGSRLPLHTALMQQFGVSERAILRALDDLQRAGRVIRRPGLGTLVAESGGGDSAAPAAPATAVNSAIADSVIAVTRVDHSYFDYCLDLLCAYAQDRDFSVLCKPLRSGEEPTPESLGALAADPTGRRFMFFGHYFAPVAKWLQDRGARVVVVGTPFAGVTPEAPFVYGNHEYGGYLITRRLIALGHRRMVFVHYDPDLPRSLRWQGHQQALREARRQGIEVQSEYLQVSIEEWETDPTQAADLLRRPEAPTAIMAWNDREAIRLLSILRRAGFRVPEDISLTGYDDLPSGQTSFPPLTTVDPGVQHQLRAAVDLLLLAETHDKQMPLATVVIPTLVERESDGPAPQSVSSPLAIAAAKPSSSPLSTHGSGF